MWSLGVPTWLLAFNNDGAGGATTGDGGSGSGSGAGNGGGAGTGGEGKSVEGKAGEGTDAGKSGERTFTQAELDAVVKERVDREKKNAEAAAQKARDEATAAEALKNGEFQKLAETRASQLSEAQGKLTETEAKVETLTAQLDAANKAISSVLKAQRDGLPKHILSLLDRMAPAEQLEYIAANAKELKIESTSAVPNHGTQNGGAGAGSGTGTGSQAGETPQKYVDRWAQSRYRQPEAAKR